MFRSLWMAFLPNSGKSVKLTVEFSVHWFKGPLVSLCLITLTIYPAVLMSVGWMRFVCVAPIVHGLQQVRQDHVEKQKNANHQCPFLDFQRHTTCCNTCAVSLDGVCVCVFLEDLYLLSSFFRQKFSWISLWHALKGCIFCQAFCSTSRRHACSRFRPFSPFPYPWWCISV